MLMRHPLMYYMHIIFSPCILFGECRRAPLLHSLVPASLCHILFFWAIYILPHHILSGGWMVNEGEIISTIAHTIKYFIEKIIIFVHNSPKSIGECICVCVCLYILINELQSTYLHFFFNAHSHCKEKIMFD